MKNDKQENIDALIDALLAKRPLSADEDFADKTLLEIYKCAEADECADNTLDKLFKNMPLKARKNFTESVLKKILRASDVSRRTIIEKVGFFAATAAAALMVFAFQPVENLSDLNSEYFDSVYLQQNAIYELGSLLETEEFFESAGTDL